MKLTASILLVDDSIYMNIASSEFGGIELESNASMELFEHYLKTSRLNTIIDIVDDYDSIVRRMSVLQTYHDISNFPCLALFAMDIIAWYEAIPKYSIITDFINSLIK